MTYDLIELSTEEVNIIATGLGELPAKHSAQLLFKLRMQCQQQEFAEKAKEQPAVQTNGAGIQGLSDIANPARQATAEDLAR